MRQSQASCRLDLNKTICVVHLPHVVNLYCLKQLFPTECTLFYPLSCFNKNKLCFFFSSQVFGQGVGWLDRSRKKMITVSKYIPFAAISKFAVGQSKAFCTALDIPPYQFTHVIWPAFWLDLDAVNSQSFNCTFLVHFGSVVLGNFSVSTFRTLSSL